MLREIQRRDALIEQLTRRVEALERARPATAAAPTAAAPARPPPNGGKPRTATAPPAPPPAPPAAEPAAAQDRAKPDDTQEEMIARALENTLVDQGGQLLPAGTMQIVPDLRYSYHSLTQLSYVNLGTGILPAPVTQRVRQDMLQAGLGLRIGLPWESQFEIRVPYGWNSGQATFGGSITRHSTHTGIGDVSIGLSKQVLHEHGLLPDVLLNLFYYAGTGSSSYSQNQIATFPFAVGTGTGFDSLQGSMTLLKRQDPLVFLGQIFYTHNFPGKFNGISTSLGDSVGARVSTLLAASPETSLRLAFDTVFQSKGESAGRPIPGSDQVFSWLEIGAGVVLSPRVFLDASVGIGLTQDTPDFRVMLSMPIRF